MVATIDNPSVKGARMTLAKPCLSLSLLIPNYRKRNSIRKRIHKLIQDILPCILWSVSLILVYNSFTRGLSITFNLDRATSWKTEVWLVRIERIFCCDDGWSFCLSFIQNQENETVVISATSCEIFPPGKWRKTWQFASHHFSPTCSFRFSLSLIAIHLIGIQMKVTFFHRLRAPPYPWFNGNTWEARYYLLHVKSAWFQRLVCLTSHIAVHLHFHFTSTHLGFTTCFY